MDQELINLFDEYVSVNDKLKVLEAKKTDISTRIKEYEKNNPHISFPIQYGNKEFKLTYSTRKTISEKNKPLLLNLLNKLGKSYLLLKTIDIDKDALYTEIQNGLVDNDKDEILKYMKVTEVKTLSCTDK